jgi:nicotinamidase-related amidase
LTGDGSERQIQGRAVGTASVDARPSTLSRTAAMTKRVKADQCLGVIIDVQEFFLSQLNKRRRLAVMHDLKSFVRLLDYFRIPILVTLERPLEQKGILPRGISEQLGEANHVFEKNFFDLTAEKKIRDWLGRLKKGQVIIAGCETDVCVLQSCLGFLSLGYEVFMMGELLFSSSHNVDLSIDRMRAEGAIFLSYKSLFYELVGAVEGCRHAEKMVEAFGPFPDDLPDCVAD